MKGRKVAGSGRFFNRVSGCILRPMPDVLRALARATNRGALPLDGLVTAGQPTAEQVTAFAEAGIRTVIDLRPADEDHGFDEPALVAQLGMTYIHIPTTPDTLGADQFDRTRAVLNDRSRYPILLHCRGANRAGAVMYPWLVLDDGRKPDDAFDLVCAVGLRSAGYAETAFAYVEANQPARR